ncbi:MAG: ABC transporter ATP-binding protein [Vallitaleaceae bacterium]|nr:ABC transporter ATP-binding protein [Vallitaleaceae bacterium]
MMDLLTCNNISKVYGGAKGNTSTNALNGVDLKIQNGEFVGVMGPSGSGKTTLLNILSGIDLPTSGQVLLENKDICSMNMDELALFRRKRMGFVFQEFNLLDSLTIKENIILPLVLDKKDNKEIELMANKVIKLFDIEAIAAKYPYEISGGQQQRGAIARAIINTPAVVYADEPTGNLDSKASNTVMSTLERMNMEEKVTVLMVTHDPFAASYCKRIIFIKDGVISFEIAKKGSNQEFFEKILDCLAVLGGEKSDL